MDACAERVCRRIRQLKDASSAVPVARPGEPSARLEPVTWQDVDRPESVALLAQWRLAAADAFPTQFPVTLRGTRDWLRQQVLDTPDRLLFWVVDGRGNRLGHLGLARFDFARREAEVDNVVRGLPGSPGLMADAVRALGEWATAELSLDDLSLRVFSDNRRAIRLYERCGFRESTRVPLACVTEGPVVRWVESDGGESAARYFVTMRRGR
jgi:RimJ/RimL family protein N-acetyltransferase